MACKQQVRTAKDSLQLPNQVLTEQESLVVVKKLLAIAVSGITYLRGLFPEKAYGSKHVEDQRVMILREERSCPGASQIVQWMQGCFEAIQKKYLRTVIMSIYTDPEIPEKVTEFYQFRIQYTSHGAQMDFESSSSCSSRMSSMSCGNTKKACILLVRKLYMLMQNLGPLPESVCLNMKLAYYEDVTPQDYQPPGFKAASGDTMEFQREPVKLAMGQVQTPFHGVKMDMGTERQRVEEVEESLHITEKWVLKMGGTLSQFQVTGDPEKPGDQNVENSEVVMMCDEKMEEEAEEDRKMEAEEEEGRNPNEEAPLKRTRSRNTFRSTTVSVFEIPTSQETPQVRLRFSEPKDQF